MPKKRCNSCQMVMINGVPCHERGCPEAWRESLRSCLWCGTEFRPKEQTQTTCCKACLKSYLGG